MAESMARWGTVYPKGLKPRFDLAPCEDVYTIIVIMGVIETVPLFDVNV